MSKFFLYIDESKNYKNGIIYIGGIITHLGFHAFEKLCVSALPPGFPYELKSTRPQDRKILENLLGKADCQFGTFVRRIPAKNDTDYIDGLLQYLELFFKAESRNITSLEISADFIRLDSDMRKLQRSLSKKFSNHFGIPIVIEFKNSSQYRSIQFADLAVGIYRRE